MRDERLLLSSLISDQASHHRLKLTPRLRISLCEDQIRLEPVDWVSDVVSARLNDDDMNRLARKKQLKRIGQCLRKTGLEGDGFLGNVQTILNFI